MNPAGAALLALAALLPAAHAQEQPVWMQPPVIEAQGEVLEYRGFINPPGAEAVLPHLESGRFRLLRIESAGGEILSALRIGRAVHRQKLDVTVRRLCASSCANYIFPAGQRKKIEEGGIVTWHGDARQRSFLLRLDLLREWEVSLGKSAISAHDRKWIADAQEHIRQQDAFYALVGVKDGIARVGQELAPPVSGFWALPVKDMASYGISNVEAPADYAAPSYCAKAATALEMPRLHCLDLTRAQFQQWARQPP